MDETAPGTQGAEGEDQDESADAPSIRAFGVVQRAARLLDAANPELGSLLVLDEIFSRTDLEIMRMAVERIIRHDLKAHLSGITHFPGLIITQGSLTADQHSMLEFIRAAGGCMPNHIKRSLALYRLENETYTVVSLSVDLRPVIDKACDVSRPPRPGR
ncbi:hypothetical protein [Desulfolutivibrio sp.]|uniref:hypothetical protein n=1 Tax=Desulfolutivibrio sp. TaxID=2773296 RepID=UPI002F963802